MKTEPKYFGKNRKGEEASLYTLKNKQGMVAEISDFGATLQSLWVLDKDGNLRDVVLGYDAPEGYEGPSGTFFGATVGRNANRICKGKFTLNGKEYTLAQNNGENNLHSGYDFYSFRVWKTELYEENKIIFSLFSPDGDQGFPGNVTIKVTYTLTDENELKIDYWGETDADTILNMTNHSYFNLNGHDSGTILEQVLLIDADAYTPTDETLIPTGELMPVEGTPMDFRSKKRVGKEIKDSYPALVMAKGYDHNWALNNNGNYAKVAELFSETSNICMEVYTDLPGIQIYTANYIEKEPGKRGSIYEQHQGMCFETQFFPDAIHHENFKSPVCKAGEVYRTTTMYKFL